jgi:hypothetical protein
LADAERTTRTRQLKWWAEQFAGLALAEVTADAISQARDRLAAETFTRGKPRKDRKTGETIAPKEYKRSGGTVNRYIACLWRFIGAMRPTVTTDERLAGKLEVSTRSCEPAREKERTR